MPAPHRDNRSCPARPTGDAARESVDPCIPASILLRGMIDRCTGPLGFQPVLTLTGPVSRLPSDVTTDLVVALREALTNVTRHANARSARVDVEVTVGTVVLRVVDDGIGPNGVSRGCGLADLRRRAAWHGGGLTVRPAPAGGTELSWWAPFRSTAPRPPRPRRARG